jgi:protein TonB
MATAIPTNLHLVRENRAKTSRSVKRHAAALLSMAIGGSAVLGLVYMMNEFTEPPKKEEKAQTAAFKVEKKKPPKRKPKPKRTKRRQVKTSTAPRAPMPDLGSALSGVSFDLPGIEAADFGKIGEKLIGDTSKKTPMTADVVDEPPKPRQRVQPEFPERARQRGISGYVTLRIKVGADGNVETVRVVEANPPGIFEEPAIASIKRWQFSPALYQGDPVEVWANQTLRFELN